MIIIKSTFRSVMVLYFPPTSSHTFLFGCLALDVTELASPRAEKDLGLMSGMEAPGSLDSAP